MNSHAEVEVEVRSSKVKGLWRLKMANVLASFAPPRWVDRYAFAASLRLRIVLTTNFGRMVVVPKAVTTGPEGIEVHWLTEPDWSTP